MPKSPIRQTLIICVAYRSHSYVLALWYFIPSCTDSSEIWEPLPAWGLTMGAFRVGLPLGAYGLNLLNCLFGAFILRCSACTVNDIFDRNLDAGVGKSLRFMRGIGLYWWAVQNGAELVLYPVVVFLSGLPRSISSCSTPLVWSFSAQYFVGWREYLCYSI